MNKIKSEYVYIMR